MKQALSTAIKTAALLLLFTVLKTAPAQTVTDNFAGTGALAAGWTQTSAPVYDPCQRVSGTAQPVGASGKCMVTYTGTVFNNDQFSQFALSACAAGSNTGPVVHMTTAGTGYQWLCGPKIIYRVANGTGTTSTGISCPTVNPGDTWRLSIVGTTLTCANITTGLSGTGTDSTYTTGAPGIFLETHAGSDAATSFVGGTVTAIALSPAFVINSTSGNVISITGTHTAWLTTTPTFTLSGGTGASITAQSIISDTAATITVTAGTANGTLTVTDPSTSNTATLTVHPRQTWYIRTDGGTAAQCTGHTNAAYPGSGTGQACALNHPYWLLAVGATAAWRSDYYGGDIVQFKDLGPYYMGEKNGPLGFDWNGAGINTTGCNAPNTLSSNCFLPSLPSGSAANPTQWLGLNAGACHVALSGTPNPNRFNLVNPTTFTTINGTYINLNLQGSSYVDAECLQITQATTCAYGGAVTAIVGTSKSGTTASYQWDNGGGYLSPLANQFIDVTGTTNGGGVFNIANKQVAADTSSTYGITASQMTSGTATFTYSLTAGIAVRNGDLININGTTNCASAFNSIYGRAASGVTGSTFQITGLSGSCTSQAETGTAFNNSSGIFTVAGFAAGTVTLAVETGSEEPYGRCGNAYTGNNFGSYGISFETGTAQGPSNFILKDIEVEGFDNSGVIGSHLNLLTTDVSTASYIKIMGNASAGWNADGGGCGTACESVGKLQMDHIMMDFNGTAEVIPNGGYSTTTGLPINGFNYGYAQQTGGYGDGFVQIAAGTFELDITQSEAMYNTQDGYDLLHMGDDTTRTQTLKLFDVWAEGNMGQTYKIGGAANSTLDTFFSDANCGVMAYGTATAFAGFPAGWNAGLQVYGDFCRAGGDQLVLTLNAGRTVTVQHGTIVGYGATMYDIQCASICDGTEVLKFQDNVSIGYNNPTTGFVAAGFFNSIGHDPFADPGSVVSYNSWYTMRNNTCPQAGLETNVLCTNPGLVSQGNVDTIDPTITSSSNVLHNGITVGLPTDLFGTAWSSPPSRGAYEYFPAARFFGSGVFGGRVQ